MKLVNATLVASCPPICVAQYPKLLIAGDSTAARYSGGKVQGWGGIFSEYVNLSVINLAEYGRSSRSFRNDGLWDNLLSSAEPGDFVVIAMGQNDEGYDIRSNGSITQHQTLPGIGDETRSFRRLGVNKTEVVHTFGWYLKQMIIDVRERHAVPIISSMTPRNNWKKTSSATSQAILQTEYKNRDYAKAVAEQLKADFVDHNQYAIKALDRLGFEGTKLLYAPDNINTKVEGARLVADAFVNALRCAGSDMADYLNQDGLAIPLSECLEKTEATSAGQEIVKR